MDKIGTDVPSSSWKGRDSLSAVQVEYPNVSLNSLSQSTF